ncbi:MAG: POT family MFS transporter [Planctomycetes bacterium]|nr:POT family MFS transporter [Planctomycetota bacterium]
MPETSTNPYAPPAAQPPVHGKYRTAPEPRTTMPTGIPFIVANEAAERFSYYGMTAILILFMSKQLRGVDGQLDVMSDHTARAVMHDFITAVYAFPLLGALLADIVLGKYRTILSLSLFYCLGHLVLSIDQTDYGLALKQSLGLTWTPLGLFLGLGLIAIGAGGIKPCVSAHVGDQFGDTNKHLLERVFGWFYFSINLGAAASQLLIPWLRTNVNVHVAFGIPGVLMLLATIFFWLGRHRFVHIPANAKQWKREVRSKEGIVAIAKLSIIFLFVAVFWSLFDQTHSSWVQQAEQMNREILGVTLDPDQLQAVNPLLIMIYIPLFTYLIYPALEKLPGLNPLTPLKRIAIGFFVMVPAFGLVAVVQQWIDQGTTPHIGWQVLAYMVLTASEVMVSITVLEFSYTQAPLKIKSLVMALNMGAVSLGNQMTARVNHLMEREDIRAALHGAKYFWFFTAAMLVAAIGFLLVVQFYKPRTYIQHEQT